MARKSKNQGWQKWLLGQIRIDSVPERTVNRVRSNREYRTLLRTLASLERHRDRYEVGSADYRRADKAVETFKERNGL